MPERLSDKITISEIRAIERRLDELFYKATVWPTRNNSSETEQQLIDSLDNLCRVSGMLCNIIEQELNGHIETYDPKGYINGKLSISEGCFDNYLKAKNITIPR